MAATESKTETEVPPTTGNASETKTVEVSNVSMTVTEKDIREFFSFSGNIHYVEMKSESETTQRAFVTFKESKGAHTALLLTGATIGDLLVSLSPVENYQLPAGAPPLTPVVTIFSLIYHWGTFITKPIVRLHNSLTYHR
ncbi:putative RNA recognition motif domain, nucleotide-binding alpha-beta plait domain superfamily [Helianthus anomalus]